MKRIVLSLFLISGLMFASDSVMTENKFKAFISKGKGKGTIKIGENTYRYIQYLTMWEGVLKESCVEYYDLYSATQVAIRCVHGDFLLHQEKVRRK